MKLNKLNIVKDKFLTKSTKKVIDENDVPNKYTIIVINSGSANQETIFMLVRKGFAS
jgi:hypothetical protein